MNLTKSKLRFRDVRCEPLEKREMLTTGISSLLDANGVLRITGTEAADFIFVYQSNNRLQLYGEAHSYDSNLVKEIVVDAKGGDDVIRLDSQIVPGWQPITRQKVTVHGGAGNDYIFGSEGNDFLFGGDGNDVIWGFGGHDYIDGGAGNDILFGGNGNDMLAGDLGNDILLGEAGIDFLMGGDGDDVLYGGDGDDWLDGGRGMDWLIGEAGNDFLFDDPNGAYFIGGAGNNATLFAHYGWFDMNIDDAGLRSLARSRYTNFTLDRNDMLAIFDGVKADGSVSAGELLGLRTIVANAASLQMSDSVRVLTSNVVNAHVANATFQGAALGNLFAGSGAAQLDKLVGKWFLGTDRPTATFGGTTYAYRQTSGQLFVGGISFTDIRQGYVGDCYLLAGLAEVALWTPNVIQNMITANGDGTYTVRFFKNGVADYVTVDSFLPTDSSGRLVFAGLGSLANSAANELWVPLIEKAYAQMNAGGWLRGMSGQNSYASISGGYVADAFRQITGRTASLGNVISASAMLTAFQAGQLVALASKSSGVAAGVVSGHAYALIGYDPATATFTLFNPWGVNNGAAPTYLTMTITQIQSSFSYFDRTTS